MFFAKKNRDKDIQDIKRAMDDDTSESDFRDLPELPEPDYEEMPLPPMARPPAPVQRKEQMIAPLFVKVDKYRELLTTVHEMKLFVSGVKQIFNILQDLENVRTETLKVMRASVQRLERSVLEMDTGLLRPRGVDFSEMIESETEVRHIEDSLTDLQNQIASLRRELQDLK
jgi:polyhydroxyalkanoate synthesis regulator phasin